MIGALERIGDRVEQELQGGRSDARRRRLLCGDGRDCCPRAVAGRGQARRVGPGVAVPTTAQRHAATPSSTAGKGCSVRQPVLDGALSRGEGAERHDGGNLSSISAPPD